MNPVAVVAAIIQRDGRFLVGRRPAHKRHGGLWEFPGGKVDEGEWCVGYPAWLQLQCSPQARKDEPVSIKS